MEIRNSESTNYISFFENNKFYKDFEAKVKQFSLKYYTIINFPEATTITLVSLLLSFRYTLEERETQPSFGLVSSSSPPLSVSLSLSSKREERKTKQSSQPVLCYPSIYQLYLLKKNIYLLLESGDFIIWLLFGTDYLGIFVWEILVQVFAMDERIAPPTYFQYSPSGVHSSPHHHMRSPAASERERFDLSF